jgi:hypothetical protein
MFEISGEARYLGLAERLATDGFSRFEDRENGGFFSTESGAADLLLRLKDDYDGAEPAGNSVATDVLLRLAHLTGNPDFERRGRKSLEAAATKLKSQPSAAPQLTAALGRILQPPAHTVFRCGDADEEVQHMVRQARKKFEPNVAVLVLDDHSARELQSSSAFLAQLERKGRLTIYKCENFTCSLPQSFG